MLSRRFALLLVVVALVACNNEKNRNLIDRRTDQTIRIGEEAQKPAPKKAYDPLTVSNKIWSGNTSTRMRRGLPLPRKYETEHGVTLISNEPATLSEIAAALSTQTGIPIRLADGLSGGGAAPDADGAAAGPAEAKLPLAYEGSLSGLLDLVSSNFGINWRYDGSGIRFARYETRVFTIDALPGTQSIKDGIKEDTDSSSSSSGTEAAAGGSYSMSASSSLQQSSEMSVELKVWDELNQTISSILGGVGTAVLSPSSGTATVTTTPDVMQVVAKFIEEENRRLTQQIAINVEIYSVGLADNTDFNMSFDTAFKSLSNFDANITTAGGPSTADNMANLSIAILNPKTVGQVTSVFSALSTIGDATRVSQFPMTTLNNRTVSRRVGRDVTYVASLSNTDSTSSSGFSSSTITPGTVREGFSLQLTPRLLADGRIMIQYSLSMVDIIGSPRVLDTGAGKVELPETSSRVFVQQALLKSGSTLVIGGYDDEKTEQTSHGVGNAYNYFLGGGSINAKTRSMLFLVITPQVLDVPTSERS